MKKHIMGREVAPHLDENKRLEAKAEAVLDVILDVMSIEYDNSEPHEMLVTHKRIVEYFQKLIDKEENS